MCENVIRVKQIEIRFKTPDNRIVWSQFCFNVKQIIFIYLFGIFKYLNTVKSVAI